VKRESISKVLRRAGVESRQRRQRSQEQIDQSVQLSESGPSPEQIRPLVLVESDELHPLESVDVIDEDSLGLGQDGVVGGVPGDPETLSPPGPRSGAGPRSLPVPPQAAARQPRARLGRAAGVLARHTWPQPPHRHALRPLLPVGDRVREAEHEGKAGVVPPRGRSVKETLVSARGPAARARLGRQGRWGVGGGNPLSRRTPASPPEDRR
jgi:hypothetical protein